MLILSSNLRKVIWGDTLKLALLRSLSGGLSLGVLGLFIRPPNYGPYDMLLAGPIGVPILYFVWLPFGLVCGRLSEAGVPFAGLGSLPLIFFVLTGDPLLYVLGKSKPGLIPISDFKFLNFVGIIFILRNDQRQQRFIGSESGHRASARVCGRCGFEPPRAEARFCTRCGDKLP